MNPADAVPIMLLLLFGVAVGTGGIVLLLAWRWHRQSVPHLRLGQHPSGGHGWEIRRVQPLLRRPTVWLAIRSRNPERVLHALSLSDPKPCSLSEALAAENRLFIAPPIRGWVVVTGTAVPDPADDVDICFRFLRELSCKLGEIQFFSADPILHHHAWARLEAGRVIRAYAWARVTLWNQGMKTSSERELDLKVFGYGEELPPGCWGIGEFVAANAAKVPLLAARWSLDPGEVVERMPPHTRGIAGRPSERY